MKILIDMNLSPRWQKFLTEAGLQAAHWSELGAGDASDLDIMAYAEAHAYVVLTHDLDFGAILAATHGKKQASCKFARSSWLPILSDRISCRLSDSYPLRWTTEPWLQ